MVDTENKNLCSDVDKDPAQGNIDDANNDAVKIFSASLLPEMSDDDLFEATGPEIKEKEHDIPDLESSATSIALPSTLGKNIIDNLKLVKMYLLK